MRDRKKLLVGLSAKILSTLRAKGRATRARITETVLEGAHVSGEELKNVQRRVYDAVNVLEALEVLRKEGDWLRLCAGPWLGGRRRRGEVERKRVLLRETVGHYVALRRLIGRNQTTRMTPRELFLPMLLVSAQSPVSIAVSNRTVCLKAAAPWTLRNDTQQLASLHLHQVCAEDLDLPSDLLALISSSHE